MYRTIFMVCTCIVYSSAAPQGIEPIETVAEVKPTTFDLPFSPYISPPVPLDEPRVIDNRILDPSLGFPFDVTTENTDGESARFPDVATDNYDAVTETPPENYDSNLRFYTKLGGYILEPHFMAGLDDIDDTTTDTDEEKLKNVEDKVNYDSTGETIYPTLDKINDDPNNSNKGEVRPNSVASKPSGVNKIPIAFANKPNSDNPKKNVGQNSIEIGDSVEVKPDSGEFKSKKVGFQPKNNSLRRKENTTRQVQKAGRKKFRSKCRCEKIWNCPRIQITVPRCPDEYFMCCF